MGRLTAALLRGHWLKSPRFQGGSTGSNPVGGTTLRPAPEHRKVPGQHRRRRQDGVSRTFHSHGPAQRCDTRCPAHEGLDVLEPAFCPDCEGVHAAGECVLRVIPRDPLLVRISGWLAGKVAP